MDENTQPETQPTPPAPDPMPAADPTPPASSPMQAMTANAPSGGPVPFSSPPDPSIPADEKSQALLMWVLSIFVGFISPLIFFFVAKDKPFTYHHSAQALTFSIVMAVLWIIAFILMFLLIGIFLMPILWLISLAIAIMGAIAANAGSRFEPPVSGGLSKSWFRA